MTPWGKGTLFVEPFHGDGLTQSMIWVEHDERLPTVFARVHASSRLSEDIPLGSLVLTYPHASDVVKFSGGKLHIMSELAVRAVVSE